MTVKEYRNAVPGTLGERVLAVLCGVHFTRKVQAGACVVSGAVLGPPHPDVLATYMLYMLYELRKKVLRLIASANFLLRHIFLGG